MAQPTPIARKLLLAIAGSCAALAGSELFFRFVHPVEFMRIQIPESEGRGGWYGMIHRRASAPGLPYELVPNLDQDSVASHVKTNSLGMRDDEPLPRETPRLLRVLAIGDSLTFGYRVAQEENFCAVLEDLFEREPLDQRRVELLNAGVSGYSSQDEAAAFAGKWLDLKPDLVLLSYCLNDPEVEPRQPLQRFFVSPRWWQHSSTLRFFAARAEGRKVMRLGGGNYWRYLHAPSEPAWKSVELAFSRIAELARDRKIPVVLAIFPFFSPLRWDRYPYREQHAQVARAGEANGFLVLDLLPRFEAEDPVSLLLDRVDSHPNAGGHRIAALELQRFLAERWGELSAAK